MLEMLIFIKRMVKDQYFKSYHFFKSKQNFQKFQLEQQGKHTPSQRLKK